MPGQLWKSKYAVDLYVFIEKVKTELVTYSYLDGSGEVEFSVSSFNKQYMLVKP